MSTVSTTNKRRKGNLISKALVLAQPKNIKIICVVELIWQKYEIIFIKINKIWAQQMLT